MQIGIVGGTGSFGKGLAYRWAKDHKIYIGSRDVEKGKETAIAYELELREYGIEATLVGTSNQEAIARGDVIVLSVRSDHLIPLIGDLGGWFDRKIVISPIVSLQKRQSFRYVPPSEGSVALLLQRVLPHSRVVSALHTIPANRLRRLNVIVEGDVPICGDSPEAKEIVSGLINGIVRLNPIDAGPLEVSRLVEPIVPLILNMKQYGLGKDTTIKFI